MGFGKSLFFVLLGLGMMYVIFSSVIEPNNRVIEESENTLCDSMKKQHAGWLNLIEIEQKRRNPSLQTIWSDLDKHFSPKAIEEFNEKWEEYNCVEHGFGEGPMNSEFVESVSKRLQDAEKEYVDYLNKHVKKD